MLILSFYNSTNTFKIAHSVTWTIVVAAIGTHDHASDLGFWDLNWRAPVLSLIQ